MRKTMTFVGAALLAAPMIVACGGGSGVAAIATGDARGTITAPATPPACARLAPQGSAAPGSETAGAPIDTGRIQSALDRCGAGQAVELTAAGGQGAFLSGPLTLHSGVSLVIDAGVTLFASRQAGLYDDPRKPQQNHCGQQDDYGKTCKPFITIERNASGSGVYGPGAIDGQGGEPMIYPAGWAAPDFCQSASMPSGFPKAMSWWDLANCAGVYDHTSGGKITRQNAPVLIQAVGGDNLTFSGFTLQNAPHAHLVIAQSTDITIWGIKINTPPDMDSYGMARAHNTDGIDLGNVRNVTIAHSYISDGDDHIAIGSRVGAPVAPSSNITIAGDTFYGGHGVSIGSGTSGGVENVLMEDIVVNGGPKGTAITAIHIKSNPLIGGKISRITYRNFCVGNVRYPIWLDTGYKKLTGSNKPSYTDINIDNVSIFADAPGTGKIVFDGSNADPHLQVTLHDVLIDHPEEANSDASSNADLTLLGKISFLPHGDGVSLSPAGFTPDRTSQPSAACKSALAAPAPFRIQGQ